MTELQKNFEAWWLTKPDDNAPFDDEQTAIIYWAEQAWNHQQKRIDKLESQLSILKPDVLCDTSCLLACKMEADAFEIEHKKVEELKNKLKIAVHALSEISRDSFVDSWQNKLAEQALKQIEVK